MNNTNDMIDLYKQHITEFTNTAPPNVVTEVAIDYTTFYAFKEFGDTTFIRCSVSRMLIGFKYNGCSFITVDRGIDSLEVFEDGVQVDNRNLLSYKQFCELHKPVKQPVQHIRRGARPPRTVMQSFGDLFRAIQDMLVG